MSIRSIPHLFLAQADRWESRPVVYGKRQLHWRPLTWRQVARRSLAIAEGLASLHVEPAERAAIWMKSSPEWTLCDVGTLSAGLVNVPIHDGASDQEVVYLLRDSEAAVIFVQSVTRARRLEALSSLLPQLRHVVIIDAQGDPTALVREAGSDAEGELESVPLNERYLESIRSSYLLRGIVKRVAVNGSSLDSSSHRSLNSSSAQVASAIPTDHSDLPQISQGEPLKFYSLAALEELSAEPGEVARRLEQLTPESLMTLQYTSGTTGEPKGVQLTHHNVISNCVEALESVPIHDDDVLLSFLPLSHSFERVAGYYMPILFGSATLYFSEGYGRLIRNLNEVSPTIMTGVPRIYEKIYARFRGKRGAQGQLRRLLTRWALHVDAQAREDNARKGPAHERQGHGSQTHSDEAGGGETPPEAGRPQLTRISRALSLPDLSRFDPSRFDLSTSDISASLFSQGRKLNHYLFSEFRQRLGGRLRLMVSGGAPLDVNVARFFSAAGLLILEGYGLSETGPVLTVNQPKAYRFGSVGLPLRSVEIKLADDHEILARGPSITSGYFKKTEETQALFDEEGWLKTGDVGQFDADGYLYITGRKKDLFKSAGGKLIAPQFIERLFNGSPLIEQAYVVGDRRPYCVALIVPSSTEINAWAEEGGYRLSPLGRSTWVHDSRVRELLELEVDRLNAQLSKHETIKRFKLCAESFIEGELVTASLKLKRDAVLALYEDEIEALYQS